MRRGKSKGGSRPDRPSRQLGKGGSMGKSGWTCSIHKRKDLLDFMRDRYMGRGEAGIEWDPQVWSELPGERDVYQTGGGGELCPGFRLWILYTLHSLYLWISKGESSRHPGRGVSACIFPALTSPAQGPVRVASVLHLLSFPSKPAASHPSPAIPPLGHMSHTVTKGGSPLLDSLLNCAP